MARVQFLGWVSRGRYRQLWEVNHLRPRVSLMIVSMSTRRMGHCIGATFLTSKKRVDVLAINPERCLKDILILIYCYHLLKDVVLFLLWNLGVYLSRIRV
jgi:hypothetical protein